MRRLPAVDPLDASAVVAVARHEAVELVVIGPEAPLAAGVADALDEAGIAVFGPTRGAARIETSKAFCHEIAAAAGVPMARSRGRRRGERGHGARLRPRDARGARRAWSSRSMGSPRARV